MNGAKDINGCLLLVVIIYTLEKGFVCLLKTFYCLANRKLKF